MATTKKTAAKREPIPSQPVKGRTTKPSKEAIKPERQPVAIEVKEGEVVRVYNVIDGQKGALDGNVLHVHANLSIDVLVIIPGREAQSKGNVPHVTNSEDENALCWD